MIRGLKVFNNCLLIKKNVNEIENLKRKINVDNNNINNSINNIFNNSTNINTPLLYNNSFYTNAV